LASQPDTVFASGFPAADAKRQNVGGMTGIESPWTRLKLSCRLACEASGAAP